MCGPTRELTTHSTPCVHDPAAVNETCSESFVLQSSDPGRFYYLSHPLQLPKAMWFFYEYRQGLSAWVHMIWVKARFGNKDGAPWSWRELWEARPWVM